MKAEEFAEKIKSLKPSENYINSYQENIHHKSIVENYILPIKESNKYTSIGEIGKLIDMYYVKFVRFADYSLTDNPENLFPYEKFIISCERDLKNYFFFACSSYYYLTIDLISDEVHLIDHEDLSLGGGYHRDLHPFDRRQRGTGQGDRHRQGRHHLQGQQWSRFDHAEVPARSCTRLHQGRRNRRRTRARRRTQCHAARRARYGPPGHQENWRRRSQKKLVNFR